VIPIVTELRTVRITGSLGKVAFVPVLVIHATLHAQSSASSVVPCNLEAGRITFTFPHHPTSLRKFYLTPCWTFFFSFSNTNNNPWCHIARFSRYTPQRRFIGHLFSVMLKMERNIMKDILRLTETQEQFLLNFQQVVILITQR
jgi:hypothetical protein